MVVVGGCLSVRVAVMGMDGPGCVDAGAGWGPQEGEPRGGRDGVRDEEWGE